MVTTTVSPKGSGWRATHEALTRLARLRAGLDFEEGQQLRAAPLARVHELLGYGSLVEYIERLFGYAPRLTLEKLRVAEAFKRLPALAEALPTGARVNACGGTAPSGAFTCIPKGSLHQAEGLFTKSRRGRVRRFVLPRRQPTCPTAGRLARAKGAAVTFTIARQGGQLPTR